MSQMFSTDQRAIQNFRDRPVGMIIYQICRKCGARRMPGELVRKLGSSRHNPTTWECRGGCDDRLPDASKTKGQQ